MEHLYDHIKDIVYFPCPTLCVNTLSLDKTASDTYKRPQMKKIDIFNFKTF